MVQSAIAEAKEKLRSQNMAKAAVAAGSKAPPGLMSPAELKEWVNIPVIERNVRFERVSTSLPLDMPNTADLGKGHFR